MTQRAKGGYRSQSRRRERVITPFLAVACEGDTEEKYLKHLQGRRRIRICTKVKPGHHGKQLVDDAIIHTQKLRAKYPDPYVSIIPAVLYDLEKYNKTSLEEAKEAVRYARSKDVEIWISVPVLERWFHLHFRHIGIGRSKATIIKALKDHMKTNNKPQYAKPGNARFFSELTHRAMTAVAYCRQSHIAENENGEVPCLCSMTEFLTQYD